MVFFVPPQAGSSGAPGPPGPPGSVDARFFLRYTNFSGVGPGGTQYLLLGPNTFASENGDLMPANGQIRGIAVAVDQIDAGRAYDIEVLSDPSGSGGTGPTVLATLALPVSTLRARDRSFAVPVAGLLDLGVRLVRTAGAGGSTFSDIVVTLEVSIP